MESLFADTEESTEDISGDKRSKIKSLKTRLYWRSKKEAGEGNAKLSQSESDITAGKGLGSEEDLVCSQGIMGSRALSHDSIFLDDQVLTDAEPTRVLSQENVHSKIKALQIKLQQQKFHLGPPPLVLPFRQPEDLESRCDNDSLPHSLPEISGVNVAAPMILPRVVLYPNQNFSLPTKYVAQAPSYPPPHSVLSTSADEPPLDFSSPAQFTPSLDTSAARHRMSVKPRNQRASTKRGRPATDSKSDLHTQNNIDHPQSVMEEELSTKEEVKLEAEQVETNSAVTFQHLPLKLPEVEPVTSEAAPKSSNLIFLRQDQALAGRERERGPPVPPLALRVKPPRPADVTRSERPHSSFIPSELKNKREGELEIQGISHEKRFIQKKFGTTDVSSDQVSADPSSVVAFKSSSAHQQAQGETESTRGIKRPAPGSGSFHFSITTARNRDGERPRSGSFVGVLEQKEARFKTEEKPVPSMREKAEFRDFQPRGGPFSVGTPYKSSVLPWERRDSLKKAESAISSKNITTDAGATKVEEVDSSQRVVEEPVETREVEEDEVKTAFGIKLRSTSSSIRLRSDASTNHKSKPAVCEEQSDKQKGQETSDNANSICKDLSRNIVCPPATSGELQQTNPAPSGFSIPIKNDPVSTCEPRIMIIELQTTSTNPKEDETAFAAPEEPPPAPQPAPSEVSWVSLAMEKTRSLQQLFTSRFPRDFTGVQAAARPPTQMQTTNQTETLTGAQVQASTSSLEVANQPANTAGKTEAVQNRSQAAVVKIKTSTTSPVQSDISKQINELQSYPTTTQSASVQTHPWTTRPPFHSSVQTEASSQFAQGSVTYPLPQFYLSSGQQQHPWSNRGFQTANKYITSASSTVSGTSSAPVPFTASTTSSAPVPFIASTTSSASAVFTSSTSSSAPAAFTSSTTSSAPAPAPFANSALERREKEATVQEKEGAALSGRRLVRTGTVSERAAFLEKQAERTTPPGAKWVEVRKAQTEEQVLGESLVSAKVTPLIKETKGRQGLRSAELSPAKVLENPLEEKWLQKNVPSLSGPQPSPTIPSALQPMSDSSQPSWMELAKRKSMAWSDKSMD